MKQFFVKLRSDKPFRCSVGILLCTLISGILNPVYLLIEPILTHEDRYLPIKFTEYATAMRVVMVVCSVCFIFPALRAVICKLRNGDPSIFRKCMIAVMIIAAVWFILIGSAAMLFMLVTIFLFLGSCILVTIPYIVLCFVNAGLAKNALDTIKNEQ